MFARPCRVNNGPCIRSSGQCYGDSATRTIDFVAERPRVAITEGCQSNRCRRTVFDPGFCRRLDNGRRGEVCEDAVPPILVG